MAQSPTAEGEDTSEDYALGWAAVYRMVREGRSFSGREKNCSFLNLRDGTYADVSALTGLGFVDDGRAAALVDWDLDGSLDLWLKNRTAPTVRFLHNRSPKEHDWIAFELVGTVCNSDAIGARVEVVLEGAEGPRRVRGLRAGEGYLADSSRWVHFGLGSDASVEEVRVRWPGGAEEVFGGARAGERWTLVQGAGEALAWSPPARELELAPSAPEVPAYSEKARIALFSRLPMPVIDYETSSGRRASTAAFSDRSVLINLFGSWCAPCVKELAEIQEHADVLVEDGLFVLALSVDEPGERDAAEALLDRLDWSFQRGFATPEGLEALDLFQKSLVDRKRRMPVPTSFLIDRTGTVSVIYKGPVDVATLRSDIAKLEIPLAETRDWAAPRPGRWHGPDTVPGASMLRLVQTYRGAGLLEAAASYHRNLSMTPESLRIPGMETLYRLSVQEGVQLGQTLVEAGLLEEAAEVYGRAAKMQPSGLRLRANLVSVLMRLERPRDAITHLEFLADEQPENPTARMALARARALVGDHGEAIANLERVLEHRPEHFRAHLELGRSYRAIERPADARRHLERALALRPGHPEARRELDLLGGR